MAENSGFSKQCLKSQPKQLPVVFRKTDLKCTNQLESLVGGILMIYDFSFALAAASFSEEQEVDEVYVPV